MPTLTLRIEEGSPEHLNLSNIKEIFHCATNSAAIIQAINYAANEPMRKEITNKLIEYIQKLEEELSRLKELIGKRNEIDERLKEYALSQ